jgi:hypothetical protein
MRLPVYVPDDYAQNIRQNQGKTLIFARFFAFFSGSGPFLPRFRGKTRGAPGG